MEIRISVRGLVEFILRSGDLDNRRSGSASDAMQVGARLHRMIQKQQGPEYEAEVPLVYEYDTGRYVLVIEGRADGIITREAEQLSMDMYAENQGEEPDLRQAVIDEIKTTHKELDRIREPVGVHLAQAKVYAAIYGIQLELNSVGVRMTYCNVDTEELRFFEYTFTVEELQKWFIAIVKEYQKWSDYEFDWSSQRTESIEKLAFPFEYREGQKELVSDVYRTVYHRKKLFIEAPTGVGKTIATVFPSVKAVGTGLAQRIFYLTAKTITRSVAENTFSLLRERGLQFKTVVLTAKDKICFQEETQCNPDACPYAKGHFDRVNEAMYDLLTHSHSFTREIIEEYARKYRVCPFEFCLDMSLFADGIICDYNYVFDPHVYLKRFFADGVAANYIFLVDEAHNLLERGREMYSAVLVKEDFLEKKRAIAEEMKSLLMPLEEIQKQKKSSRLREFESKITKWLDLCNKEMLALKKECERLQVLDNVDALIHRLEKLTEILEEYLEENDESTIRADLLDFYFELSHFLEIAELLDNNYVIYADYDDKGQFFVKLFCVDPSANLKERMKWARSTMLFSATLLPIQYYKKLLGGTPEDYEVYAKSVFDPSRRGLFIAEDVTSKYTRRSESEYRRIASHIRAMVSCKAGNYMVFFPSFAFMEQVCAIYEEEFTDEKELCIYQQEFMKEEDREEFLACFHEEREAGESLIGFCVIGGIFGEGIDLTGESLIGVAIVGTGLPLVYGERELLKEYFNRKGEDGFDYAYRFPGMNKVLQAAGRVIRTAEDVGVVMLLDERFKTSAYERLFPREWEVYTRVNNRTVERSISDFWKMTEK